MPRAHRHFIPGHIWHLTHRCHNKQFLLGVSTDRMAWTHWAREARKRFGFCILNYCITGNHVHVVIKDIGDKATPPNWYTDCTTSNSALCAAIRPGGSKVEDARAHL